MKHRGFTLIELIVTVAIIAALAAIAVPAFQNSQKRARRGECVEMLSTCYKLQKLYYSENDEYSKYFFTDGSDTSVAIDPQRVNFPPSTTGGGTQEYFYDYAILAEGSGTAAADEQTSLNYPNHNEMTGGNFINLAAADINTFAANEYDAQEFVCACSGNIDGDLALDILKVTNSISKATVDSGGSHDDISD